MKELTKRQQTDLKHFLYGHFPESLREKFNKEELALLDKSLDYVVSHIHCAI